jgi:hypothetical protein
MVDIAMRAARLADLFDHASDGRLARARTRKSAAFGWLAEGAVWSEPVSALISLMNREEGLTAGEYE